MVRISEIVRRIKLSQDRGERRGTKVEDEDIYKQLVNLNERMLEEYENGNLFNAALIAEHIQILADECRVYPIDINWGLVKELQKMLVRGSVML